MSSVAAADTYITPEAYLASERRGENSKANTSTVRYLAMSGASRRT